MAFLVGAAVPGVALKTFWIIGIAFIVWIVSLMAFAYLLHVAGQVYREALYINAAEGIGSPPSTGTR